jgi:hypothetical protein
MTRTHHVEGIVSGLASAVVSAGAGLAGDSANALPADSHTVTRTSKPTAPHRVPAAVVVDSSKLHSATPPPAAAQTDADRIRLLGQDIQGHMTRGYDYLVAGNAPRARAEYREVGPIMVALKQLYGTAPQARQIEQSVRLAGGRALATCRTVAADTSKHFPANFRCEQLFGPGMRAGANGRGQRNPGASLP